MLLLLEQVPCLLLFFLLFQYVTMFQIEARQTTVTVFRHHVMIMALYNKAKETQLEYAMMI